MLGIPRTTFYRWYDLYLEGGLDGLSDKPSRPGSVWNRRPDARRDNLIEFALEHEALSTRELAVKYTDESPLFGKIDPLDQFLVPPTLYLNHRLIAF